MIGDSRKIEIVSMFWDHVYRNRHIMQEFEDIEYIMNFEDLDRLYLSKEKDQEIYVNDIGSLEKNQIDCIRFQYLQYKKKLPGVIINVPLGIDDCKVTTYFLKAIQCLFKKPILIITEDLCKWEECFLNSGIDIAVASCNPLLKKNIFINSASNIALFSVREWSIIVVHAHSTTKEILQTDFKADYRIWITSLNFKENLNTLFIIYNWLTKENIEIKHFLPDKSDPYDKIRKTVMLDTFMEDVYYGSFESNLLTEASVAIANKVTKKNKDSTGTKIKRSKRRLCDDDLPDIPHEYKKIDIEESTKGSKDYADSAHNSHLKKRELNYLKSARSVNDSEVKSNGTNDEENRDHRNILSKMDIENVNNVDQNPYSQFVTSTGNKSLLNEQTIGSEYSMVLKYDCSSTYETQDIVETKNNPTILSSNNMSLSPNSLGSEDIHLKYQHSSSMKATQNIENINNFMAQETPKEQIKTSKNMYFNKQSAQSEGKDHLESQDSILKQGTTQDSGENEDSAIVKETQEQQILNKDSDNTNSKNILSTSEIKSQSLDSKLLELEEIALKKFKGSFLDSIF